MGVHMRTCVHARAHALEEGAHTELYNQQVSKVAGAWKHIMELDLTLKVLESH